RPPSSSYAPTATTQIPPLSLHDALPIYLHRLPHQPAPGAAVAAAGERRDGGDRHRRQRPAEPRLAQLRGDRQGAHQHSPRPQARSEEHTSELQSRENLVCRLLLEKKNTK